MVSSCLARQVFFYWNFRAPKRRWSQATTILALGALWSVWQSAGSLRRFSQQLLLKYCQMQNVEILLRKPGFYKKKGWLHREIMMYRYHLYNLLASYVYLDADVENRISLMGWTPWHLTGKSQANHKCPFEYLWAGPPPKVSRDGIVCRYAATAKFSVVSWSLQLRFRVGNVIVNRINYEITNAPGPQLPICRCKGP